MADRFRLQRTAFALVAGAFFAAAPLEGQYLSAADVLSMTSEPDFAVPYGPEPRQIGHLRIPDGPGPFPVLVMIHGGCWMSFADLQHTGPLTEDFTDAGVATWSIDYRPADSVGGGWPNTFLDVAAGVDHLRVLEGEHPLDLDSVVVMGHSAGGHLALWSAARHRIAPQGDGGHTL